MITLWHGGGRWLDGPEIRPGRPGRYECGVGIYLTNRYERARRYAKGRNVTTLVTLPDTIRWLETASIPVSEVLAGIKLLIPRVRQSRVRMALELDALPETSSFPVSLFVNHCINNAMLTGQRGIRMAKWLVAQGIDASCHRLSGGEQWVIVFNPAIIAKHKVISATDVPLDMYDLAPPCG